LKWALGLGGDDKPSILS